MSPGGTFSLSEPAWIVGAEVCTPVGVDAATTEAEASAGMVAFRRTEVDDLGGELVRASRLSLLDAGVSRTERMKVLAATALRSHLDVTAELSFWARATSLPMVLALPEADPGAGEVRLPELQRALEGVVTALLPRARLLLAKPGSHAFGRAGFFGALAHGLDLLRSGKHEAVVVGAVDSWCDRPSLEYLAAKNRVLGGENGDGLIPGEAAGFVLLVAPDVRFSPATPVLGLLGVSLAQEQHCFLQAEPNLADGLASAFRQLAGLPRIGGRRVDHVLSCQTGESFWGEEFARAYLRNASMMPEPLSEDLGAATLGDVGAASGVFQLRMAFHHARRLTSSERGGGTKSANAPRFLLYGSSDTGHIGACVVEGVGVERWAGQGAMASRPGTFARMLGLTEGTSAGTPATQVTPVAGLGLGDRAAVEEWALERGELHIDEIGFLLNLRRARLGDPAIPWVSVGEVDARIVSHLHAFVAWGQPALTFARTEGLTAEYHGRVRGAVLALASVGSSKHDWPALRSALESLVEQKAESRIAAWIVGMKWARGEHVGSCLEPLLASQRREVRVAVAEVMGYRRQGKPEELAKQLRLLLEQQKARPRPALGKESEPGSESANARVEMGAMGSALARMRYAAAMTLIEKTLAAVANQVIMPDLLFAAATLGSDWALDVARAALRAKPDEVDPELYVILGLGSEERDAELFTGLQPKGARHKQALCTAMGILGVPEFIPRLIERLEKEKEDGVRLAAAGALQRITGAGLREVVPAPDDELSDSEPSQEPKPAPAAGEAAPPQKPMVERTSTDPQAWVKWWAEHGRSLSARKRLRFGRRFQLIACVEEAAFAGSSQQARGLAMRELEMRTPGQDVGCWGYEPDGYVEHQVRTMSSWRAWCTANGYGR